MKTKIKHNSKHSSYKKIICDKKNFHKKKDAQRQTKIIFRFQIRKFLVFRSGTNGSDYEQVRYLIEIKSKSKMLSKYLFKLTVISGNFSNRLEIFRSLFKSI